MLGSQFTPLTMLSSGLRPLHAVLGDTSLFRL